MTKRIQIGDLVRVIQTRDDKSFFERNGLIYLVINFWCQWDTWVDGNIGLVTLSLKSGNECKFFFSSIEKI